MRWRFVLPFVLCAAACGDRTMELVYEEDEEVQLLSAETPRCLRVREVTRRGTQTPAPQTLQWSSSSADVASVEDGCVMPRHSGRTTIHVRKDGASASLRVVVALPSSLRFTEPHAELRRPGASWVPQAVVRDELGRRVAGIPVTFSIEPAEVATVSDEGVVTARAPGVAKLTASAGGLSTTTTLTVCPPDLGRLVPTQPTHTLKLDELKQLEVRALDVKGRLIRSPIHYRWVGSGSVLQVGADGAVFSPAPTHTVVQASGCGMRTAFVVDVR